MRKMSVLHSCLLVGMLACSLVFVLLVCVSFLFFFFSFSLRDQRTHEIVCECVQVNDVRRARTKWVRPTHHGLPLGEWPRDVIIDPATGAARCRGPEPTNAAVNTRLRSTDFEVGQRV